MTVLAGMLGIVVDVGQVHVIHNRLQAAADAAALAAAASLPNSAATTTACTYSASLAGNMCNGSSVTSNGKNSFGSLASVQTTATAECLSTATAGIACETGTACPSGQYLAPYGTAHNVAGCNAIKVTELENVSPWLMGAMGFGKTAVSASATATMAGGGSRPIDTEVLIDSTASMADSDSCGGSSGVSGISNPTVEDCAKDGVRSLLSTLDPCSTTQTTCGSAVSDNVANPLDSVGLMTFPALNGNVSTGNGNGIPDDTDCLQNLSSSDVTYTLNSDYYTNGGVQYSNYQIVPFSSDYRTSDSTTALNPSSDLVDAADWLQCPGGTSPDDSSTSSITAADSTDISTAGIQTIAGGASVIGDSSSVVNSTGIGGGPSVSGDSSSVVNASPIGGGPSVAGDSTSVVNVTGIGGGPSVSGDSSSTTNTASAGIAGGAGVAGDSSSVVNASPIAGGAGVAGDSSSVVNASPIAGGASVAGDSSSVSNTVGAGIGGGIATGDTSKASVSSGSASITLTAPAGAGAGSLELVTVTANQISSGAAICAPTGWTQLSVSPAGPIGSGTTAITEATFYSVSTPASYKFTFDSASCATAGSVAYATAVAVAYTNVDTTTPLDAVTPVSTTGTNGTVVPLSVTTTYPGDKVLTLFSAYNAFAGSALGINEAGSGSPSTSTGIDETTQAAAGASTVPTGVTSTSNWVAVTPPSHSGSSSRRRSR